MQKRKHRLVLARRDGLPVRVSDTVDPRSGRHHPLVLDAECLLVEETDGEHDNAIPGQAGSGSAGFTIAMFVIIAAPFTALLYLACMKGWI